MGTLVPSVQLPQVDKVHSGAYDLFRLRGLTHRSAVRNIMQSGASERVTMTITGHKTRGVFDRYHIVSLEDAEKAMQATVAAAKAVGR